MGRKKMGGEGGGPKRRMIIDMTRIAREREEEEAAEAMKEEEKKANPLLSLLGGEYDDEEDSKSGKSPPKSVASPPISGTTISNLGTTPSNSGTTDLTIDKQLDSFLLELGQITGDSAESTKTGGKEGEGKGEGNGVKAVWQACLDSESNEYYYWNTVTDEVTWDMPAEYQQQQQKLAQAKQDTKQETKQEIKQETIQETKQEAKQEATQEIKQETKQETQETDVQKKLEPENENTNEKVDEAKETAEETLGVTQSEKDGITKSGETVGKREAESVVEIEPATKKAKVANGETQIVGGEEKVIKDIKSPEPRSNENDEITALFEKHRSEMLQDDKNEDGTLQIEIEEIIKEISRKFQKFDADASEPLDDAMDSMEIDPEILLERRELIKMKIEFDTRVNDWREGVLLPAYVMHKLQIVDASLEKTKLKPGQFETWNLLPVYWTRLPDPSGSGTYFANINTNETCWVWPPDSHVPPETPPPDITSPSLTSPPPATVYSSAPVRYISHPEELEPAFPPSSPPPPPEEGIPPPPPDLASGVKKKVKVSSVVKPAKRNSVFAKWATARSELVGKEQKEEEEEVDFETMERKKRAEIEQWRTEQVKTGESENNANFVPVADWRERVERARRIAAKEKPT